MSSIEQIDILENKEEDLLKKQLVDRITSAVESQGLTQSEAARILGTSQPEVSKLKKRTYHRFRLERLFYFLNRLNINVDIYLTTTNAPPYQKVTSL